LEDPEKKVAGELTALAADIALGPALGPVGSILKAVAGPFLARRHATRMDDGFRAFVEQWADLSSQSEEAAEAELGRLLTQGGDDSEEAERKIYEYFRLWALSHSPGAWPYIARMTAIYLRENRGIDALFRRCGRLLAACEEEDIDTLRRALRATDESLAKHPAGGTLDVIWAAHDELGISVQLGRGRHAVGTTQQRADHAASRHREVVDLLLTHRLGAYNAEGQVFFERSDGFIDFLRRLFQHRPL
jgi:hypothetical protein